MGKTVNSAVHGEGWERLGTLDMGSVSVSVDFLLYTASCKFAVAVLSILF